MMPLKLTDINFKKIAFILLVIGMLILAFSLLRKTPAVNLVKETTQLLQQQNKQLQQQNFTLKQISDRQQKLIDRDKKTDSILQSQYNITVSVNRNVLDLQKKLTNEKIDRINNYGSDSLRRAFAED